MSKLDAFLHPAQVEETKEVVISKRFVGEDGKPAPFVIRSITQKENRALGKSCTRAMRDRTGAMVEQFDNDAYYRKLILACVVEPDFSVEEMCKAYGTVDPGEVPEKMLLSGEYAHLMQSISDLNRFDDGMEDDAKNS